MQSSEKITEQIENLNAQILEKQQRKRSLELLKKKAELEELHKAYKAADLETKEVKKILEAYAKGIIELPDEIKDELEEDDEE